MPRNNEDLSQGQEDGAEGKKPKVLPPISFPLPSTIKSTNRIPDALSLKKENFWTEGGSIADTAEEPRNTSSDDADMFRFGAGGRKRRLDKK
jgi:hypothetical protein